MSELKEGDQAYMQVQNKPLVVVTDMAKTPRTLVVVRRPDGRKYRRKCKHLCARIQAMKNNNHSNATTQIETQSETITGEKGGRVAQNKDLYHATSTEEEDTNVGGEVQPEPEIAK